MSLAAEKHIEHLGETCGCLPTTTTTSFTS